MSSRIDKDQDRFKRILKGKVRKELKKYIQHGEMIGRKGKDLVSIPVPGIDYPTFRHGVNRRGGGVGQGGGDIGTPVGQGPGQKGQGAGDRPGEHITEVDITIEELGHILGEELELPRLEPRGKRRLEAQKERFTSVRSVGPESLKIMKRTLRRGLLRSLASFDAEDPEEVDEDTLDYVMSNLYFPIREDKKYRAWKIIWTKDMAAAILYLMDVSGSMMDEQKEIVRTMSFWVNAWAMDNYKGVDSRYITHDAVAREVDQETFYHTRQSGGTKISSAYQLAAQMTEGEGKYQSIYGGGYSPEDINIYVLHFSDGDNWGEDDEDCLRILYDKLLRRVNLFAYVQVESPYGSGRFIQGIRELARNNSNVATTEVKTRDDIYEGLKAILGKAAKGR